MKEKPLTNFWQHDKHDPQPFPGRETRYLVTRHSQVGTEIPQMMEPYGISRYVLHTFMLRMRPAACSEDAST